MANRMEFTCSYSRQLGNEFLPHWDQRPEPLAKAAQHLPYIYDSILFGEPEGQEQGQVRVKRVSWLVVQRTRLLWIDGLGISRGPSPSPQAPKPGVKALDPAPRFS